MVHETIQPALAVPPHFIARIVEELRPLEIWLFAEPPKPDPIVIVAYLDDIDGELEAAFALGAQGPIRARRCVPRLEAGLV